MRSYEMMLVFDPHLEEEAIDAVLQRLLGIITTAGGEIVKEDKWGKRRLAYEIDENTEGYYLVINFRSEVAVVDELERVIKITGEIIRHIIVRIEEK